MYQGAPVERTVEYFFKGPSIFETVLTPQEFMNVIGTGDKLGYCTDSMFVLTSSNVAVVGKDAFFSQKPHFAFDVTFTETSAILTSPSPSSLRKYTRSMPWKKTAEPFTISSEEFEAFTPDFPFSSEVNGENVLIFTDESIKEKAKRYAKRVKTYFTKDDKPVIVDEGDFTGAEMFPFEFEIKDGRMSIYTDAKCRSKAQKLIGCAPVRVLEDEFSQLNLGFEVRVEYSGSEVLIYTDASLKDKVKTMVKKARKSIQKKSPVAMTEAAYTDFRTTQPFGVVFMESIAMVTGTVGPIATQAIHKRTVDMGVMLGLAKSPFTRVVMTKDEWEAVRADKCFAGDNSWARFVKNADMERDEFSGDRWVLGRDDSPRGINADIDVPIHIQRGVAVDDNPIEIAPMFYPPYYVYSPGALDTSVDSGWTLEAIINGDTLRREYSRELVIVTGLVIQK